MYKPQIYKFICSLSVILLIYVDISAQVKIGENPHIIHSNSILELEGHDNALVLTRLTTSQMYNIRPLAGAIIYNTDESCLYYYNGSNWINLCIVNEDNQRLHFNASTNILSLENGGTVDLSSLVSEESSNSANDISFNSSTSDLQATDVQLAIEEVNSKINLINLIDNGDGTFSFTNSSGTQLTFSNVAVSTEASNGLTKTGNEIQLGGNLNAPTTIGTSTVNKLAITGLEENVVTDNFVVAINQTNGNLSKKRINSLMQENILEHIATNGQNTFTTPLPITDINKINVYRNGIRLDFTFINSNTIQLETGVVCFQNDSIKIIQFN